MSRLFVCWFCVTPFISRDQSWPWLQQATPSSMALLSMLQLWLLWNAFWHPLMACGPYRPWLSRCHWRLPCRASPFQRPCVCRLARHMVRLWWRIGRHWYSCHSWPLTVCQVLDVTARAWSHLWIHHPRLILHLCRCLLGILFESWIPERLCGTTDCRSSHFWREWWNFPPFEDNLFRKALNESRPWRYRLRPDLAMSPLWQLFNSKTALERYSISRSSDLFRPCQFQFRLAHVLKKCRSVIFYLQSIW